MWPIFNFEMLIFQSKANFDEKILFGKITLSLRDPNIRKMSVRGLYGNREVHVPFRPIIYAALKWKFNVIAIFINRILI